MKLIRENINEAIKNMPGRSDEEIYSMLNEPEWRMHDENYVYLIYKKLIEKHPYIEEILEVLETSPEHRLEGINKYTRMGKALQHWHFYFSRHGSLYFHSEISNSELLKKHKVSIQIPGNQNYGFSISIYEYIK